ncbi:MAG: glycosyl transferase family 2 [candidate division WWE3 bacterium GW2011_GWC1_41_7]|uniref:Glycosyl transferase, family 2 n=4 Tax=Katanobacteria TaxID=422282 RepID=A0A0G0XEB3_UNCKA|nr:MAG: Glycosyl transferase, family 2 [candidate division WWE3 bacterium GW2011_GWB1_41_6]KKS20676.1 MAG: glycosyl transferase family 2 [candidate division WWE3 bacterium GW2011_GWC1_41_7]KKS22777.1 MAG: Glycosyl transferase, family 2 [candidate division WWE3 bacterium GW2011_GWA1_41_8]OGC58050.1 MAG: hypothetical protein A2976_01320 [candidate division WWE3 bacterium RIFCSPLOWO2_01_FULL_41_9]
MKKRKNEIAIIIAARNEGLVLDNTLHSIKKIVRKEHIYLVNDNSSDNTTALAEKEIPRENILKNDIKTGKAGSLNRGIAHFHLPKKYKYIMPIDADTKVAKTMIKRSLRLFKTDKKHTIVAVVGRIKSEGNSYITYYRIWEYEIGHTILKNAQSFINAISVCSGCATIYKSSVFSELTFPEDTVTEDMDLTFTIHRKKLGRIVYQDNALVYTQDPINLKILTKQLNRWYSGFWQNIVKHKIPWGGQILDFEVALLALGGVANSLFILGEVGLLILSIYNPFLLKFVFLQIILDLLLLMIPTMVFTSVRNNSWKIFLYLPHLYFIRFYSGLIFLHSLVRIIFGVDLLHWDRTQRYKYLDENKIVFSE